MSLVQNERAKLVATALNNIAVATFVTALIAPAAGLLYGLTAPAGGHFWPLIACGWLSSSVILHLTAHQVLKRLTP